MDGFTVLGMEEITIKNGGVHKEYFRDLFRFRELFFFFAWRDILVRYKQAFFGVAWALVRPLLNMVVFTFIFRKVAHFSSDNIPYPLFVLAAMLPWQFFSGSVIDTTISLLNNPHLITKMYFPRIIIPTSHILLHMVDFFVSFVLFMILAFVLGGLSWVTFPLFFCFTLLVLLLAVGTGLWLSSLTVLYRDVRFLVPFFIQFGLFISPVGYGTFMIPEHWQWIYGLNPLVGIIDGFRFSFFGISHVFFPYTLFTSVAITVLILVSGFLFFRSTEKSFADKI